MALQAQDILDMFGKFPGTVPSMITVTHVRLSIWDVDFYDRFYEASAYLHTHADHMRRWHGENHTRDVRVSTPRAVPSRAESRVASFSDAAPLDRREGLPQHWSMVVLVNGPAYRLPGRGLF